MQPIDALSPTRHSFDTFDQSPMLTLITDAVEDVLRVSSPSFMHADAPPRTHVFFSRTIPPVSARDYMMRLHRYAKCSESTLVIALIYLERVLTTYRRECPAFQFTPRNIHRYIIGAVVVAFKWHEDKTYLNTIYASVAGVSLAEINNLEISVLLELKWATFVDASEFESFLDRCEDMGMVLGTPTCPLVANGLSGRAGGLEAC